MNVREMEEQFYGRYTETHSFIDEHPEYRGGYRYAYTNPIYGVKCWAQLNLPKNFKCCVIKSGGTTIETKQIIIYNYSEFLMDNLAIYLAISREEMQSLHSDFVNSFLQGIREIGIEHPTIYLERFDKNLPTLYSYPDEIAYITKIKPMQEILLEL